MKTIIGHVLAIPVLFLSRRSGLKSSKRPFGCAVTVAIVFTAMLGFQPIAYGQQMQVDLQPLHAFTSQSGKPEGLIRGSDGLVYGWTASGEIFKIDGNGALTTLYSYTSGTIAQIIPGQNGFIYGATTGDSKVFRLDSNGTLTVLCAGNDGVPTGIAQGSDGSLYVITWNGGLGHGSVLKLDSEGALTTLYSFTAGADGRSPNSIIQGNDGFLYGTTPGFPDGVDPEDSGTVFKLSMTGELTTLHTFGGWSQDGSLPGNLIQGNDGFIYGTTRRGGGGENLCNSGSVFRIDAEGRFTTVNAFCYATGVYPEARLFRGSDGILYGTTYGCWPYQQEGFDIYGTVFRVGSTGFQRVYSFTGGANGRKPNSIVQGSDGCFYGTTFEGGENNFGVLFKMDILGLSPYMQELATAQQTIANLTSLNTELEGQLTNLTGQVATLTSEKAALQTQLGQLNNTLSTGLISVQNDFRLVFKNPGFTIPGSTNVSQYQNLIYSILSLNKGGKNPIYLSLNRM